MKSRDIRRLFHSKLGRRKAGKKGTPLKGEMHEGEPIFRLTSAGMMMFVKHQNKIYESLLKTKGGEIQDISDAGLTTSSMAVTSMTEGTGVTLTHARTGAVGAGIKATGALTVAVDDLTVSELHADSLQTSSESFVDNDTSLMTSAAIQDKILAYGYSTTTGDVTASSTTTFTNKTIDADGTNNSITNIDIGNMTAACIVTESETIASNDNDTTLPTSAAVRDYVDNRHFVLNMGWSFVRYSGTANNWVFANHGTFVETVSTATSAGTTVDFAIGGVQKAGRVIQSILPYDVNVYAISGQWNSSEPTSAFQNHYLGFWTVPSLAGGGTTVADSGTGNHTFTLKYVKSNTNVAAYEAQYFTDATIDIDLSANDGIMIGTYNPQHDATEYGSGNIALYCKRR